MISTADLVHTHNEDGWIPEIGAGAAAILARRRHQLAAGLDGLCRQTGAMDAAARAMVVCLRGGGRVLTAGNGGSAAEAQHLATELVGRFLRERGPHAALSLTADTAVVTAIANDYGFDAVFARQVRAHGRPGDVLIELSTSGESTNLVEAADAAHEIGMTVIALTGASGSRLAARADIAIGASAGETPVVQELHTVVLHVLCDLVETALAEPDRLVATR